MYRSRSTAPLTDDLRQPAGRNPALHFHLNEAIRGVSVTQSEEGVVFAGREDVRDPMFVVDDLNRGPQAGQFDRALAIGDAGLQPEIAGHQDSHDKGSNGSGDDQDDSHSDNLLVNQTGFGGRT